MNEKMKNLTGLFRDTRTRTIIILTGIILGIAVLAGIIRLFSTPTGPAGEAKVGGSPQNIESIPGGFDKPVSQQYAQLVEKQNQLQVQTAQRTGGSAIPTIIRATTIGTPGQTQQVCCGAQPACGAGPFPPKDPNNLAPGKLIYDAQAKVIGTLGPDGKARNSAGLVIGTIGPDGLIRDTSGSVIGAAGAAPFNAPAFDNQGAPMGAIGVEGKVRDTNKNILGNVVPNGEVRDANCNVVGKASSTVAGTPVYDSQGRLIGYVGADGKVRDANGNVVGTVGADGLVRDANGNVIGKANSSLGTPVYDAQGRLIGYAGPDGKVRDASGKVIGTVGADGLVRDANGNIIGKAGKNVPGTPVYDSQGRLIGVVGADGKVRDANGNVIGTVGPDGVVRDASGNVVGKVGETLTGTPVYDAQGHLIGIADADGKVRDASGHVIGTVGIDGVVRDAQGNPIGSTNAGTPTGPTPSAIPATAQATSTQSTQLQTLMQRQAAQVSAQRAEQLRTQIQGAMAGQANQLLAAWGPPSQSYVAGSAPLQGGANAGVLPGGAAATAAAKEPSVKAGTVMFAVLTTAINSDEPGPILATIVDGKFKGARIIGTINTFAQGQKVQLNFATMSLPGQPASLPINAVAIDQKTARTALSDKTDNHYLLRYGTLFASAFLQGYGQAVLTSGNTTISNGSSTTSTSPDLDPSGKFMVALGNVGNKYSQVLGNVFNRPPTVYVNSGTGMGILFMQDVPALPVPM